jgi:glycolate oxidase
MTPPRLPSGASTDPDIVAGYGRDETGLLVAGVPRAVVSPRTVEEVQEVLRWASDERVPVLARGGGTGLTGAAIAVDDCIVISTARLNRIRELDAQDRLAVVEAGVINADLNLATRAHGLMWAPDPSSWESSTVGGNVATNAGGLRCLRYGATRANVLGLEVVLADGRVLRTGGRTLKRSAGYDLTQLLVGSEGTLGVVTAVTARLQPQPAPQLTALATFSSAVDAAAAAAAVTSSSATPTLVELMDATTVAAVDAFRGTGFGRGTGAVLITQVDQAASGGDLEALLRRNGSLDVMVTSDRAEADVLLDVRRAAYPALRQLGVVLVEDVAVPVSRLARLMGVCASAAADSGITIATVAHAGDGNAHPLLVVPPGDDGEARAWAAADVIFAAAQQLGGTVSGEHGIGRIKKRWLAEEVGSTSLEVQRQIKSAFDPLGILNPGAIL